MKEHRHQQVYRELKQRILGGEFGPGDWLPSENILSATYGIARMTVRQALTKLERESYIERRQGRGSLVKSPIQSLGLLSFRGFSEVVGSHDHTVQTTVLQPLTLQNWPVTFFYPLTETEFASPCFYLQRLRFADRDPVMWEHTWLPQSLVPNLSDQPLLDGSLFNTLRVRHQIEVTDVEQHIRAVAAAPEAAQHLAMPTGQPLLHIYRRYQTSAPNYFIYSSLYCNTSGYAIGSQFTGH